MSEYKTIDQINLNWGESFNMTVKAPLEANRRFLTLGDAEAYVRDAALTATPGLVITVLSSYVRDAEATYEANHFVCAIDVYTNFTWETAVGKSEGDTYTLSNSELEGAYYIKSVGDGTNPGELVKISGSGGGSGTEIKKYATLTLAEADLSNLEDEDIVVVYGDTASQNKAVYYVSKPVGQNGQLIKLAPSYWFSTKADAQTFAGTCELGTIVSVYNDSTAANNGVYYVVAGENNTRELVKIGGADPIIRDTFYVTGVEIGGYHDGDEVPQGMWIDKVIERMLTKEIDVSAVVPSASSNNTNFPSGDVEVGETRSFTLGMNYTDGYYESSNKAVYTNAKFDELNEGASGGKLNAGCVQGTRTYKYGSTELSSNEVTVDPVQANAYSYSGTIAYSASNNEIVPKKNTGVASSVSINAGNAGTALGSFNGRYKIFYGYIVMESDQVYDDVVPSSVDTSGNRGLQDLVYITSGTTGSQCMSKFITSSTVNIGTMISTSTHSSFAIIMPDGYVVTEMKNSQGQPVNPSEAWYNKATFTYTHGGNINTTYKLYVMHRTDATEYRSITVGVANNS